MIISSLVAAAQNNAIGKNNQLPWHLPDDLRFFKRISLGKPVLMGRKTYESLGKPLPNRTNIVISTNKDLELPEGVILCTSLEAGLEQLRKHTEEEGIVIGGGLIFGETMDIVDRIYLTRVDTVIEDAEAFFPELNKDHWVLASEEFHDKDEKHAYSFRFQTYNRILP